MRTNLTVMSLTAALWILSAFAAAAMSFSSVSVIGNSLRLRFAHL